MQRLLLGLDRRHVLVVPAAIANLFTGDRRQLVLLSWGSALASILGLWVSYTKDLPTGPLIVCMYGALLRVAAGIRKLVTKPA